MKLYSNYGKSSPAYEGSENLILQKEQIKSNTILKTLLDKPIEDLELNV